jgi:hypothetical protein
VTRTRTYDPARNPPQWNDLVRPGQHTVFVVDASTRVACDTEGRRLTSTDGTSIAVCDDLPDAANFAKELVTRHPALCCEIYDHEGKSKDPLQVVYNPEVRGKYEGLPYAKRMTFWGSLACLCGIALLVYDFRRDLTWLWGYFVGLKLVVTGGFCLAQGLLGWSEHRRES